MTVRCPPALNSEDHCCDTVPKDQTKDAEKALELLNVVVYAAIQAWRARAWSSGFSRCIYAIALSGESARKHRSSNAKACMCVCIYVCMCMYGIHCMPVRMHACMCASMRACIFVLERLHLCMSVCVCLHVVMYARARVRRYVCMSVFMYVGTHVCM